MKALTPGYEYILNNFEYSSEPPQILQFIYKLPLPGTTDLVTVKNGTTNEEILAVLIDRVEYLDNKFPCIENGECLIALKTALRWLNNRTAARKARNVEGTAQK